MPNRYNTNTRRFTTDNPVLYNGQYYPSTTMPVDDGNGNIQDTTVFADRNGNYFNQSGTPVMLRQALPEVVVFPTQQEPTQEEMAANMFNSYLTMSNDNTKVSNVPHRQYNTHLNNRTIQGAKSNALWEKEHPNLDAWGKTLAAIPFAVAAAPAAIAGGKALAGTAAGQYIKNEATKALANPLVEMANVGLGLGFGAKGAYDVSQGDVTPSTLLELAGIYPGIKAAKNIIDKKRFVSELDWTPENWFKMRFNGIYDKDDIKALKAHIPEYHKIEKQAKANGTWLKMPDGSTWEGDPRSWVQLQSKDGQKLMQKLLYHGDSGEDIYGNPLTPEKLGSFKLWTSTNKYLPQSYGRNEYHLAIPKTTSISSIDAKNSHWSDIQAAGYKNTDAAVDALLNKDGAVEIKNVIDLGPSLKHLKPLPDYYLGESVTDYTKRVFAGDDIILGENLPRKSLLGNNGNFDFLDKNIYKGLLPLGISTLFYSNYNNK